MFIFGHLGIGSQMIKPWSEKLPRKIILLGTVLPDLVDKPLYLLADLNFVPGLTAWIPGTRTFGHTALLLIILCSLALVRKSKALAALCLGIASHLLLDSFSDRLTTFGKSEWVTSGLLWPFFGDHFPQLHYASLREHLATVRQPVLLYSELTGIALLAWHYFIVRGSLKRSKGAR